MLSTTSQNFTEDLQTGSYGVRGKSKSGIFRVSFGGWGGIVGASNAWKLYNLFINITRSIFKLNFKTTFWIINEKHPDDDMNGSVSR